MPHPYYGKELKKRKSQAPWFVAILILAILLVMPWFLPESSTQKGFFKYVKAVTTFPMTYEWTHIYRYAPPPNETPTANDPVSEEPIIDDSFFPLAVGNKWTYEHKKTGGIMNAEEKITTKTIEIVEDKMADDVHLFKAVSVEEEKTNVVWYYWDHEGLHVTKDDKRPWAHSLLILKASPKEGDTWLEAGNSGARSTVTGEEDLHISSGLYKCILIETRVSKGSDRIYTTWYASGVGIVRQHFGSKARGQDVWELRNFIAR